MHERHTINTLSKRIFCARGTAKALVEHQKLKALETFETSYGHSYLFSGSDLDKIRAQNVKSLDQAIERLELCEVEARIIKCHAIRELKKLQ